MNKAEEIKACDKYSICWWHPATTHQIRFFGHAHLISSDSGPTSPAAHQLKDWIYCKDKEKWTWENELHRVWSNQHPMMRGTFRNPHPGTPLSPQKEERLRSNKGVEADDTVSADAVEARSRFCLIVFNVIECEILQLEPRPGTRTRWRYKTDSHEWEEISICP